MPNRCHFALPPMLAGLLLFVASTVAVSAVSAADAPRMIEFTQETLPNGLRVIYAPLHQAPVVEVRVFYHVGSRDERPDRQGFAHMFEHMMFRGSTHVKPQEHMKVLAAIGAQVNAFTYYDQTVYHETLPASALETALYLEADRMAGFKVSDTIFGTERKVVAEEWRDALHEPALWADLRGFSKSRLPVAQLSLDADREHGSVAGVAVERVAGFFQYLLSAKQRDSGSGRGY